MRNLFNSVKLRKQKRNKFPLSFTNHFTTDYGNLTPCMIKEANAGEIFRMWTESFIRTQPLRAPAFIRADATYHYFFVPFRLCYDDWTNFIVRGREGDTDYDKPYVTMDYLTATKTVATFITPGSLYDFLNFPTLNDSKTLSADLATVNLNTKVDMMPFNAYNLIYNEYYRDENLIPEVFIWSRSGYSDNYTDYLQYYNDMTQEWGLSNAFACLPFMLRKRAWRKDYFTSALPFVQKGSPISLMSSVSPVTGNNVVSVFFSADTTGSSFNGWFVGTSGNPMDLEKTLYLRGMTAQPNTDIGNYDTHAHQWSRDTSIPILATISLPEMQSTVMTISDLRVALALQQWFELNARTGSDRYYEYLLGHFGVRDRDSRLQRPEYIGGFTHELAITEVEQTSSSNSTSPQGNLAGKGLGFSVNTPLRYRMPEPGFVMCIQSIMPHATYYQGWPRMYQRWDCFDYFDPLFDHLSEQAIKQSELYWHPAVEPLSQYDRDFGYTPRFSEYRTSLDEVHGDFRSSLSYWVCPRQLSSVNDAVLDQNFITCNGYYQGQYEAWSFPGSSQNPAPHFVCLVKHHIDAIRPMSKYATPYL